MSAAILRSILQSRLSWVIAAGVLLTCSPAAHAESNIRAELAAVAKELSGLLSGERVQINDFKFKTEDAKVTASAGPGLAQILAEELVRKDVIVVKNAPVQINGIYTDGIDKQSNLLTAALFGEVVDENGKVITGFKRSIFGDAALAAIFGTTANLSPKGDLKTRSDELMKALDKPQVHTTGARVTTTQGTPYAVELLVLKGKDYVPRTPTVNGGQAFVKINREEIYAVKLINNSASEAAIAVSIDGISMFAFSENKNYTQVIVPAKSVGFVKGWHRSNTLSDAFQVMEYSKSAVAQVLPSSTSVGVITATFSTCFPKDAPPPEDEPPSTKAKPFSRTADATGRGPELKEEYTEVEREFGVVRTTISVRYTK